MVTGKTDRDAEALAEIKAALGTGRAAVHLVYVFGHGIGLQVKLNTRKIGPVILPGKDQTTGSLLTMLGVLVDEANAEALERNQS